MRGRGRRSPGRFAGNRRGYGSLLRRDTRGARKPAGLQPTGQKKALGPERATVRALARTRFAPVISARLRGALRVRSPRPGFRRLLKPTADAIERRDGVNG